METGGRKTCSYTSTFASVSSSRNNCFVGYVSLIALPSESEIVSSSLMTDLVLTFVYGSLGGPLLVILAELDIASLEGL